MPRLDAIHEAPPETVRVLIVDNHPIVRMGLRLVIEGQPDLAVCGEAPGVVEAMQVFVESRPHLVIADLSLENGSGIELVKELVAMRPGTRILVLSLHDETLYAERVLRAGAMGYVNKDAPPEVLVEAIRRVLDGKVFLSERMTERMLCRGVGHAADAGKSPVEQLSDREIEVFELIGQGITTKQIAVRLDLSPKTIETYRENIKSKLGLENATELVQHAVRWVVENA